MEELKKRVAELKEAMTPEAMQNLTTEEIADLKALINKLRGMIDGTDELEGNEE